MKELKIFALAAICGLALVSCGKGKCCKGETEATPCCEVVDSACCVNHEGCCGQHEGCCHAAEVEAEVEVEEVAE